MPKGGQKTAAEPREVIEIPAELPALPVTDTVVFPYMMLPLVISDKKLVRMADESLATNKIIAIFARKYPEGEEPAAEDLYSVGTASTILKMLRFPDNSMRLLVQGIGRVKLESVVQTEPYLKVRLSAITEDNRKTEETSALMKNVTNLFQKLVESVSYLPEELKVLSMNIEEPGRLADIVASNLNVEVARKQEILETVDAKERLQKVAVILARELELLEIGQKIQSDVKTEMDRGQREYYLRQQLKAIQKELGEVDERTQEADELREKIKKAQMPHEAEEAALKEVERLSKMAVAAAEYTVSRTYLDWLVSLPWSVSSGEEINVGEAAKILEEDHHDLEKVKERILEYLAVRKLKKNPKGPILCLVGPPGVGKTSLGMSIARALGRKFVRMSLGGMRDEAEIRGHRRTYIGALPGRIIQGMRKAESNNPVFMLDEVDKIGADFRGDPAAALLEVLDPEQNFSFSDHYLSVAFDLSKVVFITTANLLDPIPTVLRDRMEVLELPGYTREEKLIIAKKYLVPRQYEENGISQESLVFKDDAVREIISNYTMEAGVRNLEREIATVCRKVARQIAEGKDTSVSLTAKNLSDFLGPEKFFSEIAQRNDEVGVATGLAWTAMGGEIMFVEAQKMKGGKSLSLTGNLGEVMKESAQAALSYVRSLSKELGVKENFFDATDIHIHVPAGSIPKDGPSAGVAMVTCLASLVTGIPVKHDVAMTGEITLRGRVLPIGGVRQKVLAAHRAGIKTVVLPRKNEKDLVEVPEEVRKEIKFVFVERIDEMLSATLSSPVLKPTEAAVSRDRAPSRGVAQALRTSPDVKKQHSRARKNT
ncbi:MAG: endopeptidase La [Candidatus Eisenbacteria bacterium]|nr:endopeptidase La [Candidatus Eisenbacteria bacterium]